MMIPIPVIVLFVIVYAGIVIAVDRIVIAKGKVANIPVNIIPEEIPALSYDETALI